ncbi:hypothetical protein GCM10023084_79350 [Streptomyces lacrimifluminis]|uniref:Uncharacterized protein n=1 Tax=Streptomyces lacrimifluminis TaxID=1500077 RepID=A0A917PD34_9ACTN|nr:hypothetical protein GCM10012282_80010 [Streptomyces lacrimifluminis]
MGPALWTQSSRREDGNLLPSIDHDGVTADRPVEGARRDQPAPAQTAATVPTGGQLYTAGAVIYRLKRPDPSPAWFGFHEAFHALTIAAFTAHYTAIFLAAT